MLEPAVQMTLGGITVGPMDNPAFIIPFIFTKKFQPISLAYVFDPGSEIDIVGNQYRLTLADTQDNPLMSTPFEIVLEHFFNYPRSLDLKIAHPVFIRSSEVGRISGGPAPNEIEISPIIETGNNQYCQKAVE
jgi:hypothetical protein